MLECEACNKHYSNKYNLEKHWVRQPLCKMWLDLKPGIKDYVDDKFNLPLSEDDKKNLDIKCFICNTQFANIGNLNRHLDTSVICGKWKMFKDLEPLSTYIQPSDNISYASAIHLNHERVDHWQEDTLGKDLWQIVGSKTQCENSNSYVKFIPQKCSLMHIIWNVFLVDKEVALTPEFACDLAKNNVRYITAIVPKFEDLSILDSYNVKRSIMEYIGHDVYLDQKRFDEECAIIEDYRKRRENVIVFCNKGYQRSLPFLTYYLVKHHNDEVPTVEKAIDIILPQVDKTNYAAIRKQMIENVEQIITPIL